MSDIQNLEISIEEAKSVIKLRDQAERLIKNRDYKAVIEDAYFEDYVKNTALMLSEVKFTNPEMYKDLIEELEAVGRVRGFIRSIFQKASMAEKTINDANEEIEFLRKEGEDE